MFGNFHILYVRENWGIIIILQSVVGIVTSSKSNTDDDWPMTPSDHWPWVTYDLWLTYDLTGWPRCKLHTLPYDPLPSEATAPSLATLGLCAWDKKREGEPSLMHTTPTDKKKVAGTTLLDIRLLVKTCIHSVYQATFFHGLDTRLLVSIDLWDEIEVTNRPLSFTKA